MNSNSAVAEDVNNLCDDYLTWKLSDMPEVATLFGVHEYDDRLTDLSEAHFDAQYRKVLELLSRVDKIEPLLPDDKILKTNLLVLKYELQTFKDGFQFKGYYLQVCNLLGPHSVLPLVFNAMPLKNLGNYQTMLSRLRKIPLQIDQTISLMKKGVENGIVFHYVSMKGISAVYSKFIVDDPFYDYFKDNFPDCMTADDISNCQESARQIIPLIYNSFVTLKNYIETDYKCRENLAITSLPDGENFYKHLLRFHTSSELTSQEIQNIGFSEVKRIEKEMKKVITELGYDVTIQEFSEMIKNDPKNYYASTEELLDDFKQNQCFTVLERMPGLFKDLPYCNMIIEGNPSPVGPYAQHVPCASDESRPGRLIVKTHNLQNNPKYISATLALHEGNPGHELQGIFKSKCKEMHPFRKVIMDITLNMSPTAFPIYMFFHEGWALYAEKLGFEMDMYDEPLDRYGHYSEEMFRACRLVVDTGLHALGWTRQEAIEFMVDHSASSRKTIENEIDRYISWPGQALSYKIGAMGITSLREKAHKLLKEKFDLKQFHNIVLSTFGSFEILQKEIDDWIEKENSED